MLLRLLMLAVEDYSQDLLQFPLAMALGRGLISGSSCARSEAEDDKTRDRVSGSGEKGVGTNSANS